ncbi:MAG TPA: RagB/SusD family nutrient uptake outer membrane protein, partial [Pelobium sp.]|nr:RagB/SusD family nutrient uptake outer membrane protein [Pelobium sp.]
LFNVYATCVVDGFITGSNGSGRSDAGTNDGMLLAASDEGDQVGAGGVANTFNLGTWGPNNQGEFYIGRAIQGCRNASVFLENVDKVPFIATSQYNWTPQLKAQTIAEAKVLRALMHYEMMIRYGGIPIISAVPKVVVTKVDGVSKATVVPSPERQPIKDVIDFIVKSCDEAIPSLPDSYPSSEYGRLTKGAALALKAVTLLHAASPLYNALTPPVDFGDKNNLLCYGDVKDSRWNDAANASKAVLDWAASNNIELLDDNALGKSESYNYATGAVLDPRNKEIIQFDYSHPQSPPGNNFIRWTCPIYYPWGNVAMALPINFVKKTYRDVNGNLINLPDNGTFIQLKQTLKKMEPRFQAVAWWYGSQYTQTGLMNNVGGADTSKLMFKKGGVNGQVNAVGVGNNTNFLGNGFPNGFNQKKFTNLVNAGNGRNDTYWPIFRLGEFYLDYAEALNEVTPNSQEIITALNAIRKRGGIPLLAPGNAVYDANFGDKVKMREVIRRERSVELFAEEHRFFDVRRWKIAGDDGVMRGDFYRIFLYENGTGSYVPPANSWTLAQRIANDNKLSYKVEKFETRVWDDKHYFYPFPQDEVNKGFLVQNP